MSYINNVPFGQNFEKYFFFGKSTYYISFFSKIDSKITGENRFQIGALVLKLYAKTRV